MRLKRLDVLRAIAIILVMFRHMNAWPENEIPVVSDLAKMLITGGWIGVDLFFVLSGFLVSGLIFSEYQKYQCFDVKRFFIRRGFRIYPAFYFFLLLVLVMKLPTEGRIDQYSILSEIFYLQNYNRALWTHTWTLAVEEHFYFILGTILFFAAKGKANNPFKFIPKLCLFLTVALLLLRIFLANKYAFDFYKHLFPTHMRIDSLFFGTLLSYLYHFKYEALKSFVNKHRRDLRALPYACLLPAFLYPLGTAKYIYTFGFIALYVGFGCVLLLVLFNEKLEPKTNGIGLMLAKIGMYSYSIYLWHMPVKRLTTLLFRSLFNYPYSYIMEFLIYVAMSLVIGICMAKFIEAPFLKIRNKYYPSRSR